MPASEGTSRRFRPGTAGGITLVIEGFGWFAVAAAALVIVAPAPWQRLMDAFYSTPKPFLRTIGVLNILIGLVIGLFALSLM